jgi:hypothetical protein
MRYILQAVFALAVLIGMPVFMEAPATTEGMIAASVGALILVAAAIHGFVGFARSRKPRVFLDSVLPPKHVDLERTVIKPLPKRD